MQGLLPGRERALEALDGEAAAQEVRAHAVGAHMVEGEHEVHFAVREEVERLGERDVVRLADYAAVIALRAAAVEAQVIVQIRPVHVLFEPVRRRPAGQFVREAGRLRDIDDGVLAEAVHAELEPEAHDIRDLAAHGGVVVVEVGLLLREDVQVVFAQLLVVFPGLAAEEAVPVVRLLARAVEAAAGLAPEVVVAVRVVPVAAEPEPLVLRRGVVYHEVHDYAHPALMRPVEHLPEYLHVPVLRVYGPVVGHVVAVVEVGRGVERRKPYRGHAERGYVVELLIDAVQVADAVAVPVAEAARPNLVYDRVLVPFAVGHTITPS